ncbi:VOC family protein [Streptomyces sp. NPDC001848]|uniref:VOC family protein n=1 Tax=Streptomyces sp. NPDC001848 TaxID=3364618 RepID=UPI0036B34043
MGAALDWKLVVDTQDAPALADFWAAALGYEVEDNSALINRLLAAGQLPEAAVAEHNGTRIFRGFAAIRHPDDPYDKETGIGRGRRILFQDVPEESRSEDVTRDVPDCVSLLAQSGALPAPVGGPARGS